MDSNWTKGQASVLGTTGTQSVVVSTQDVLGIPLDPPVDLSRMAHGLSWESCYGTQAHC
jgi:hypothetical protein